jgi:hypothetical protein
VHTLERATPAAVEVAHIEGSAGESSRAILEATGEVDVQAHYERETRTLPAGTTVALTTIRSVPSSRTWRKRGATTASSRVARCRRPARGRPWPVLRLAAPIALA